MSLEVEYRSLRHGAALSRMDHVGLVRVSGDDATEAVDAICSGDLWVRDGRMLQTLILGEQGHPVADVYVCPDDEACILMFEGITTEELSAYLAQYADPEFAIELEDLRPAYELISVNGPYAWEAMSKWLTPDVIGLPYLSFYHFDRGTCFRAGKTGEYGYDLAIRNDYVERAWEELLELVGALGGGVASLETLDLCALENGFFSVRHASVEGLTPLELQLQWRVSARKRFPGATAIEERRAKGMERRLTHFVAREGVETGDPIRDADGPVGQVTAAAFSPGIGGVAGMALLDLSLAHPGIDAFFVPGPNAERPIRTVSSPLLFNRSLLVDPHRHTYATRDDASDPALWMGSLP
jgi:glycine cleavage system aminomethyltransferase T